MTLRTSCSALFAVLLAAAPATAATTAVRGASPAAGPVLAGDSVVWVEGGAEGPLEVKSAGPDGIAATLVSFPALGPDRAQRIESLAASPSHAAFIRTTTRRDPADGHYYGEAIELWAGAGTNFTRVDDGCGGWPGSVDLDGSVLAYAINNCSGRGIVLRDLASDSPPRVLDVHTGGRAEIDLEGRYLAWWAARADSTFPRLHEVIVHDLTAGQDAYRVDVSALVGEAPYGYEYHFDLQPDGKLALAWQRSGLFEPAHATWFSPAEPSSHPLPAELASPQVTIAGDQIATCRRDAGDFAVLDLAGGLVNRFDAYERGWACGKVAFDGRRLAWVAPHRGVLYTASFPAEPPPEEYPRPFFSRVGTLPQVARPDARGLLTMPGLIAYCPSRGGTCTVRVELTSGRTVVARRGFRVRARQARIVTARLTRGGRAALRRRGRLRARATVRVSNLGGTSTRRFRLLLRR